MERKLCSDLFFSEVRQTRAKENEAAPWIEVRELFTVAGWCQLQLRRMDKMLLDSDGNSCWGTSVQGRLLGDGIIADEAADVEGVDDDVGLSVLHRARYFRVASRGAVAC